MTSRLYIGNGQATPSVVVEKPVPMPLSVQFTKDSQGKLVKDKYLMDLSDIEDINDYVLAYAYYNNKNLSVNNITFSNLNRISGYNACQYMFYGCTGLTGAVDLSNVTYIENTGCHQMFSGCTGITSVDLSGLETLGRSDSCNGMFSGCTGLISADLSSLEHIGSGGSSTCSSMFFGCTNLENVDLSNLEFIGTWGYSCRYMFQNCTSLISINLPKLISMSSNQDYMFSGCTNLTTIQMPLLTFINSSGWSYIFNGCTKLSSVDISHLAALSPSNSLQNAFQNCTSLKELRFNKLAYTTTNINNAFTNMLNGCSDVVVHFPAVWETDMASYSNVAAGFGGTNTTVLFDLPDTTILDLSYITRIRSQQFKSFTSNCYPLTNITSVDFSNLETIDFDGCRYMFQNCTSLITLSFPALKNVHNNVVFRDMLQNVTGCTVHFPSNLSSRNFNCGGTNTTILYDLPATE